MTAALSDVWAVIGDDAGAKLLELFDHLQRTDATRAEVERSLSMLLVAQNVNAGVLGEALARNQLTVWDLAEQASRVPATELATHLDRPRLQRAVSTVLDRMDPAEVVAVAAGAGAALHRLARSEALETGRTAFRAVMIGADGVGGWERELEPDACELCHWWHDEGLQPKGAPFPAHKGCTCAQRFTRA